jgi:hypothetical protein
MLSKIAFSASPTIAEFMRSAAFGRVLAGPVGSGKTTGCIYELLRRCIEQEKGADGFRYTRWAIVRQTLKQLVDTVLKDIEDKLHAVMRYKVQDKTVVVEFGDVRSEWLLLPLEDAEDQRRLLSMQLTGAWMSEGIEMDVNLVSGISARCGRYPSGDRGTPTWFGVICDTNMPSEGSEWHKFMTDALPKDWEIFIQPGGLEEHAENLQWLTQTAETIKLPEDDPKRIAQGRLYYERATRTNNADWVKRYVHAQFGNDPSGTAVFRESFKSDFHVREGLMPHNFGPLLLGQDFGRDPCSLLCQVDSRGRLLVLEEIVVSDIGLEQHLRKNVKPLLMGERYFGIPLVVIGDPSGTSKSTIYEESTFDVLKKEGFTAVPAPTNDLEPRIRAVESLLLKQIDGGGMILFDKQRCPLTIRAMAGDYRYAKTRMGIRKPLPDKNDASHIMDALQYVCLVSSNRMNEQLGRFLRQGRDRSSRPRVTAAGWT